MHRYDIKPIWKAGVDATWSVIDTANRDMPTGHEFQTREEALRHAQKMDKGKA